MTVRHDAPRPDAGDDWLERALDDAAREHPDRYIADEGFTARVVAALPPPAALPAWRRPALALLWAIVGVAIAAALPGAVLDIAQETLGLLAARSFALSEIGAVLAAGAAAMWAGVYFAWRDA
jgi:hypothetical protein